jgi:hypothetical protein
MSRPTKNQGEKDVFEPKEFVSSFLPPMATALLVRAARAAAELPEDSVERKKLIEDAIAKTREMCPNHFRRGDSNCGY